MQPPTSHPLSVDAQALSLLATLTGVKWIKSNKYNGDYVIDPAEFYAGKLMTTGECGAFYARLEALNDAKLVHCSLRTKVLVPQVAYIDEEEAPVAIRAFTPEQIMALHQYVMRPSVKIFSGIHAEYDSTLQFGRSGPHILN